MSENRDQSGSGLSGPGYETRDVDLKKALLWGVGSIVIIVVVIVIAVDYFTATQERMMQEYVLSPKSTAWRELRARENEELTRYGLLDSVGGIYQIPIERAMKLMAEEAYAKRQAAGEGL
jgi:hypothetical protein